VIETSVLLKVAQIVATPETTFFEPLALMTFAGPRSVERSSAAEGASAAAGPSFSALSALFVSFGALAAALGASALEAESAEWAFSASVASTFCCSSSARVSFR
jgi:hypothetical protein